MMFVGMSTKTKRFGTDSGAIVGAIVFGGAVRDVDAGGYSESGCFFFHVHEFLWSLCNAMLSD